MKDTAHGLKDTAMDKIKFTKYANIISVVGCMMATGRKGNYNNDVNYIKILK